MSVITRNVGILRWVFFFLVLFGCDERKSAKAPLFELLDPDETNIDFSNDLEFSKDFNIYTYRNFYNGGGVGIGDFNNDGLVDVYLTGNQVGNKLYLNKGNFSFEDITESSGVRGKQKWSTGVSVADVNGDGFLDIYVSSSGNIEGDPNKQNELFINNGNLTFTERATEYGVADKGYTTHAAFFDYDRDGDLDLYILNNSYQAIGSFNLRKNIRDKRDAKGGHKLLRNDSNHFIDVSEQAGIYGSVIAFGLGVTIGDINKDGWPDIFVSNDFFERDYLYLNNRNGTFKECLTEQMRSISGASMGADLADINNDTWSDLFVTEMLPKENARLKTITTFEDWNRYQYNVENGYYHQFTRNMLQLNNANNTFSEIGRFAGVEATDWSWGALIFDMDNDGWKDIFVANGIYQDLTNQDFLQFASNEEFVKSVISKNSVDYKKLTEIIPSNPVPNFAFHNAANLTFADSAQAWGLATPGFSNGAAYADLDNDGDLDLIVNNVNMKCFVYRNNVETVLPGRHFLKFNLVGDNRNTYAVGSKITVFAAGLKFYVEQNPIRGFESTVDPRPNVGLGRNKFIDSARIEWPDGRISALKRVVADTTITLNQSEGTFIEANASHGRSESSLLSQEDDVIDFTHVENLFVDFDREPLLYHMISTEGPRMSKADVNRDGRDDLFIGGARGSAGALFVQLQNGTFKQTNVKLFETDKDAEDMGSEFFDADGDGDVDLYVCSGGNETSSNSPTLIDRLYLNDGNGVFTKSNQILPTANAFESTSTVKSGDYDRDGDNDLFVGVRVTPFYYGLPNNGYILQNDGKGKFTNVTDRTAPELASIGMITDAQWSDIDKDADLDLIVIGEYMPVKIFVNENGRFTDGTLKAGLDKTNGWWNSIEPADLDSDGDIDFVVGNHGLNSRLRASEGKPLTLTINDFDQNGTVEHILSTYQGDVSYPFVLRHELISQIPSMKKKYLKYENFKDQKLTDIFGPEQLKNSIHLNVFTLASSVLVNDGRGKFIINSLPPAAQMSPVYGIEIIDIDADNHLDILLGGNLYKTKPQVGRYDASYGVVLKGDGKGNFVSLPSSTSGLLIDGEVRDILSLQRDAGRLIVVARNNNTVLTYALGSKPKAEQRKNP